MNLVRDIIHRLRLHQSERRIADDLSMARKTVHKYHEAAMEQGWLQIEQALPTDSQLLAVLGAAPKPPRRSSTLEPHRDTVCALLDQGVEMTALHDRLCDNYGYTGSYSAVRRFVQQLCPPEPHVVVRVVCQPGEEAQVDFGAVGQLYDPATGQARRAYVFVATLSYSRHQYAELVWDQTIPTWIGLHRRAFESWGGVPHRVVLDNLKAAVVQARIYDPILGEAYRRLAQHYGFLVSPNRPATPQHKGKVESGVHYVKRNFMAGQEFADLATANQRLQVWVAERAGTRLHGTTRQPPLRLFHDVEQAALLPLPSESFELREIRLVKVHPDCHVVIQGSRYSVPYQHVGQKLEAHVGERVVELFHGQELVATHERAHQAGQCLTRVEHYPPDKAAFLEQTTDRCQARAAAIGPATSQIVVAMLADRPLDRLRSAQGLLRLAATVGDKRLEAACARVLYFAAPPDYRHVKEVLNAALDCEPLPIEPPAPTPQTFAFARPSQEFFPPDEEVAAC